MFRTGGSLVGNALTWINDRATNHFQVSWKPKFHIAEIRDTIGRTHRLLHCSV